MTYLKPHWLAYFAYSILIGFICVINKVTWWHMLILLFGAMMLHAIARVDMKD